MADRFLAEVGGLLQYASFTPEETLVSFSDPADQLIIICDGKVLVKFEHSWIVREPMELRARECFRETSHSSTTKTGVSSTVFNLEPNTSEDTNEATRHLCRPRRTPNSLLLSAAAELNHNHSFSHTVINRQGMQSTPRLKGSETVRQPEGHRGSRTPVL